MIKNKFRKTIITVAVLMAAFFSGSTIVKAQTAPATAQPALPAAGTSVILGTAMGVAVEVKTQSPSNQATPLQIICVF